MSANLTKEPVATSFGQLLHVDGGITGVFRPVHTGAGVETALALSTAAVRARRLSLLDAPLGIEDGGTGGRTLAAARAALGIPAPYAHIRGEYVSRDVQTLSAPLVPLSVAFAPAENAGVTLTNGTQMRVAEGGDYLVEATLTLFNGSDEAQDAYAWLSGDQGAVDDSLAMALLPQAEMMQLRLAMIRTLTPGDGWLGVTWTAADTEVVLTPFSTPAIPVQAVAARVAMVRVG